MTWLTRRVLKRFPACRTPHARSWLMSGIPLFRLNLGLTRRNTFRGQRRLTKAPLQRRLVHCSRGRAMDILSKGFTNFVAALFVTYSKSNETDCIFSRTAFTVHRAQHFCSKNGGAQRRYQPGKDIRGLSFRYWRSERAQGIDNSQGVRGFWPLWLYCHAPCWCLYLSLQGTG